MQKFEKLLKTQKLLRNAKPLLIVLLLGLVSLDLGCANKRVPKPPPIEFYIHDKDAGLARCSVSDGSKCPPVPMADTGNWYLLKPGTRGMESLQNYLDLLACRLRGGCEGMTVQGFDPMIAAKVPVSSRPRPATLGARDVERLQRRMNRVLQRLERQVD